MTERTPDVAVVKVLLRWVAQWFDTHTTEGSFALAARDALALIDSLLARAEAAEVAFCEAHLPIPEEGTAECARCLAVHERERAEAAEKALRAIYAESEVTPK